MKIQENHQINKAKGFTLIELVIAVFIITVGVVTTFAVLQNIIVFTSLSSSRLVASYLAQEGVEIIRNIRDTNFLEILEEEPESWFSDLGLSAPSSFLDYRSITFPDTTLCNNRGFLKPVETDDGTFYQCSSSGKFARTITVQPAGAYGQEKLEVTVVVEWTELGTTHRVSVQEDLYDWLIE